MKRPLSAVSSLALILLGTNVAAQTSNADSSATVSKIFSEAGGFSASVGVRLWGNQWDIPGFDVVPQANSQAPGGFVLQDTSTNYLSSFKIVAIPFIGVRIGNVIASASYFFKTHYDAQTPRVSNMSRDELDLTLGYSLLPVESASALVISVGYKRANIEQTLHTSVGVTLDNPTRINAGLIGFSGNAPLTDNLRLYGNAAYGLARQKINSLLPGDESNSNLDGAYRVGEVGLSYSFFRGSEGQAVRSANVALGYRAQIYTIKSASFNTRDSSGTTVIATEKRDVNSTTQGPILTLSASF